MIQLAAISLGDPDALGLPTVGITSGVASGLSLVFAIIGAIAVGFVVYGGVQYTLSGGDPAGTKKAKDTILNAIIGLVITLVAFGIVNFVTRSL
jgi:hypothetical protein